MEHEDKLEARKSEQEWKDKIFAASFGTRVPNIYSELFDQGDDPLAPVVDENKVEFRAELPPEDELEEMKAAMRRAGFDA